MSRPFPPRSSSSTPFFRVNGKIRAREVRVIGSDGQMIGVISLNEALTMARQQSVDRVEIAPTAQPPVCKLVDYGKFRYEQAKKDKESKKHQHANKVKEVQLSANIDPHDFSVKFSHAVDFFCEDMKVKVALRFRGREMAHTEFGFQIVNKFIAEAAPWAQPDAPPKLVGKSINIMLNPLPRNKRAKHPQEGQPGHPAPSPDADADRGAASVEPEPKSSALKTQSAQEKADEFSNNPFSGLDLDNLRKDDGAGNAAAA
ncbi:MAG: translation initiation factor IF-3 [Verrucomicrobia bacterium]|nr:translation initiation factor IF-3 [Verrucomicrobiota bacterium]